MKITHISEEGIKEYEVETTDEAVEILAGIIAKEARKRGLI